MCVGYSHKKTHSVQQTKRDARSGNRGRLDSKPKILGMLRTMATRYTFVAFNNAQRSL